ncbi:MAG: hypothetical protein GXC73_12305, partial [Chitinophagaceae bacterium]|nr:hypothetical protein [Chitinophagaceae bacterium]
ENVLVARNTIGINEAVWEEMAFKYNLVEFCTSIKPACFQYLFKQGYEKVIYLDPDIYVFGSMDPVFSKLENASIILTPHIVSAHTPFEGDYPDYLFLVNGTFNLGFLAVKKSEASSEMLYWWNHRLKDECFFDNERGMATDQKWMNMLPSFFTSNDLHVSHDLGLNVAPWNYHERKLYLENETIMVCDRITDNQKLKMPLQFVHFSGYDYRSFVNDKITHKNEDLKGFDDLTLIFEKYAAALKESDLFKFYHFSYTYGFFKNGKVINHLQRRIYRRLLSEGLAPGYPFDVTDGTFYAQLVKQGLVDHSSMASDKVTNKTIKGFNKKLQFVNTFFRVLKFIIGIRRYSILIRFLRRYFREENQAFLYDKSFDNKSLW